MWLLCGRAAARKSQKSACGRVATCLCPVPDENSCTAFRRVKFGQIHKRDQHSLLLCVRRSGARLAPSPISFQKKVDTQSGASEIPFCITKHSHRIATCVSVSVHPCHSCSCFFLFHHHLIGLSSIMSSNATLSTPNIGAQIKASRTRGASHIVSWTSLLKCARGIDCLRHVWLTTNPRSSLAADPPPQQDFKSATTGVAAKAMRNELNALVSGIDDPAVRKVGILLSL